MPPYRALLLLVLLIAAPASAASFDCAKARTATEIAVCRTPALSLLDTEMGALWFSYSKIPMLMGSKGARHDDAEAFLASRNACGSKLSCLTTLYQTRNATLRAGIVQALGQVEPK